MSPRTILFIGLAVAATLLLVPAASAQAGSFTLAIDGISEQGPTLKTGTDHTMQPNIKIAGTGFICSQEATLDVLVEPLGDAPDMGLTATVAPSTLTFTIPAGAYLSETGQTWSPNSQPVDFTMAIAEDAMQGHETYGFGVKATYDGTAPTGCQAQSWGQAEAQAPHTITIDYPEPVADDTGDAGNLSDDAGTAGSAADVEESPGLGPVFLGTVFLVGLVAARRRA